MHKMEPYQTLKLWFISICICSVAFLSGCASSIPVGKYEALQDSSQSLLTETTDTYTRIEKLQRYFAVITAPNSSIDVNTFKPVIEGQSFDLSPELRFREAALEVLFKYTAVLSALATKDYQSDVDKASQELAGSLKNLITAADKSGTADAAKASGIFATLVNVVGKQIVEYKRAEALRKAMDTAQDSLNELSNLIVGSNKKIKTAVDIMRDRIIAHANTTRPAYATAQRSEYDMKVAELLTEIEEIETALDLMNDAISRVPEAHREIRAELDKKTTSLEALQKLVQEAQRAEKLYRNLNK